MEQIVLLTLITLLTQIQWSFEDTSKVERAKIDCSRYIDDNEILHSFPFPIHLNPEIPNASTTYAKMTKTHTVISLKIVDQECIPSLIFCLKYLSQLQIRNTSFCHSEERIPADIQSFAFTLTELDIFDTKITYLPKEIGRLKRLRQLTLSNTGLKRLPSSIDDLCSLKFLILSNNNLSSLPDTMINLLSLHQLTLNDNPNLRSIKSINDHPNLIILDTRNSPIQHLPQNLPQLAILYMSDNKLTHLNRIESLGNATDIVKTFDFRGNAIRTLTPRIRYVRKLNRLNLARNQLTVLPTDIFEIPTLAHLNIKDNPFPAQDLRKYIAKFRQTNPNVELLYN